MELGELINPAGVRAFGSVGVAVLVEDDDMQALIGIGRDDSRRPHPAPTTGAAPRAAISFNKALNRTRYGRQRKPAGQRLTLPAARQPYAACLRGLVGSNVRLLADCVVLRGSSSGRTVMKDDWRCSPAFGCTSV